MYSLQSFSKTSIVSSLTTKLILEWCMWCPFLASEQENLTIVIPTWAQKHAIETERLIQGGGGDPKFSKMVTLQRPQNRKMVALQRPKFAQKGFFLEILAALSPPRLIVSFRTSLYIKLTHLNHHKSCTTDDILRYDLMFSTLYNKQWPYLL